MKLAFWMALRSLRARLGALLITILAVALATATALVVPLVTRQVERGAQDAAQVFDLLIAAPGSGTQAVMSSLFYLDVPTGNISEKVYRDLESAPGTRHAIPIGLGDNYRGFPIVGTSPAFFKQRLKPKDPPYFRVNQGNLFKKEHEVVIGAKVALQANLKVGDTFKGSHGLHSSEGHNTPKTHAILVTAEDHDHDESSHAEEIHHEGEELKIGESHEDEHGHDHDESGHADDEHHEDEESAGAGHDHDHDHGDGDLVHDEEYTVVGIMAPTGGPADRAILTPIESIWEAHGQEGEQRQVTAVLYSAEQLVGIYNTARRINAGKEAMAVFPGQVFAQAKDVLLQGQAAYAALSILVLGIAALTVWLSVYTSGVERQRMVALLRTLGSGRGTVFTLVLLETFLTVTLGVLLGIGLAVLVSLLGGNFLGQHLGFTLAAPQLTWPLVWRTLMLIPLGLLAALPPAITAMRASPLKHLR